MVPSAFGFSAGDIVAAIELTIKIGKAIRETGGATTEYRLASQDIQFLRHVLESHKLCSHVAQMLAMSMRYRGWYSRALSLREFAEKLDNRYSSALSVGSAKNAFSRSGKKAQWAISAAEEVSKFRAIIAAKVVTISIQLGVCNR